MSIERVLSILWCILLANRAAADQEVADVARSQLQALAREHVTLRNDESLGSFSVAKHAEGNRDPSLRGSGSFVEAQPHRRKQKFTEFLGLTSPIQTGPMQSAKIAQDTAQSSTDHILPGGGRHGNVAQEPQGTKNRTKELVGVAIFLACSVLLAAWGGWLMNDLHEDFSKAQANISDLDWKFMDYVMYVFGYWLAAHGKRSAASLLVLLVISAIMLLLGTFSYWLSVPHASIWHGAWVTYIWLTAPDGGIGERTISGAFCGASLSLCGLLVFALLLTLLNDLFQGYMDRLRDGNYPVMEVGHIVVIGLTSSKIHLLHELCSAYAVHGGVSIVVVLGGIPKHEMNEIIDGAEVNLQGSKIILRSGHPQYQVDLERASLNSCRSVIIMADHRKDKEVRDAFVLQTLLVLRSNGWPRDGHILLECSLLKNRASLEKIGGSHTDIIMTERWLSRLFLQVSQQAGLGVIINETFSFDGATLYIQPLPAHLEGKQFQELAYYYPDAVPVGTITKGPQNRGVLGSTPRESTYSSEDEVHNLQDKLTKDKEPMSREQTMTKAPCHVLGNTPRGPMHANEDVIFMAHDNNVKASFKKFSEPSFIQARTCSMSPRLLGHEPEIIIVVGWSLLIGPMLVQVDKEVHAGTRVICMSPLPVEERHEIVARAERRWQHKIKNITLEHVQGMLGSPTVWDRLPMPLEEASRIFILSDSTAADARHADACTVAAVIQVRHILAEREVTKFIPIVPEIQDPRTEKLCKICNISSYVDSSGMPVQVLAAVSFQPRLREVLRKLVGDDSEVGYSIRSLSDYIPDGTQLPESISFMQIHQIVAQTPDVVIGWSWIDDKTTTNMEFANAMAQYEGRGSESLKWELNPADKAAARAWTSSDRICILGPH